MSEGQPQSKTLFNQDKGEMLLYINYNEIIQIHSENMDTNT